MPTMTVKNIIIPAAGFGTRFLPLSRIVAKHFLALADEPMIDYIIKEAKDSAIEQIIFILSENKNGKNPLIDYYKPSPTLENLLSQKKQTVLLEKLKNKVKNFEKISFSAITQKIPKGDGDAILKAKRLVNKDGFAVAFCDDIFQSEIPATEQLKKVFDTSQKTVIGLKQVSGDKISHYGCCRVEKIANRLYKIKEIVEKPALDKAPSDLAFCGRYIFTPEIFPYLEKAPLTKNNELILAEAVKAMLEDGKIIYGWEIEGQWLECGKMEDWLHSNLILSLGHPEYGEKLRDLAKKILSQKN